MLGIVASEPTGFRLCLHEAPRSLATLSEEHPHGWGIAVFDARQRGWSVQKSPACARRDQRFSEAAAGSTGHSLVAHVRKRTVGPVGLHNTHPFRRGGWVFAHNGTIEDTTELRARTSPGRLAEVQGETDSELLFAHLLTLMDEVGPASGCAQGRVADVIRKAVRDLLAHPGLGAANFLLSNGDLLFAFRRGRSLFVLERGPDDPVRESRRSPETGASIDTRWTARRRAVLVASEAITDEPWREVPDGALLVVRREPQPELEVVTAL